MPTSEQVKDLLLRYRQGLCTAEETQQIEDWYGESLDQSGWDFQPGEEAAIGAKIMARMEERLRLKQHLNPGASPRPADSRHRTTRILGKWAPLAAAACLVLAIGIYLFLRSNPSTKAPTQAALARGIAPGGDKAVLTLGNGERIILDSAANGTLAQQGFTKVVKRANGQLVYETAGSQPTATVFYNTLTTPRGGIYQLTLPDGTRVWLNSASSIRYPNVFTDKDRNVEVTGEVYLDVARNDAKPFIVSCSGMQIQVLGTEFNLMAYTDEDAIRATLVNGSIKVIGGNKSALIKPREQAVLSQGNAQSQGTAQPQSTPQLNVVNANLQETLAWKEGSFRFYNTKLTTIMRQITRWYDVDVVYEGSPPADDFYCVVSRKQYVAQLLDILEQTNNVHFRIDGRKIIVMAGPR